MQCFLNIRATLINIQEKEESGTQSKTNRKSYEYNEKSQMIFIELIKKHIIILSKFLKVDYRTKSNALQCTH